MNRLTVFYDERCELCCRCRDWLSRQPTYVALEFISLHSPIVERRFPGLAAFQPDKEILVVSDAGGIYRGGGAWLMVLWATQTYREWAGRLAHPALFPMVRKFCSVISANRLSLSALLHAKRRPEQLAHDLEAYAEVFCPNGTCGVAREGSP